MTSTSTGKAAYVRATATRAAAPDAAEPLVPCRLSASVGSARSCDRTCPEQACGCAPSDGRCRVRPRRVASSSSQARAWPTPSSFTEEADFMRFSSLRAASARARARPCCVFQNVACRREFISFQRDASASRRASSRCRIASSRCRRVVASSKTHCLPVAQKSGVANSMKVQGSKFRVQSSGQIFSSPG